MSPQQIRQYHSDGYIIVKGFCPLPEVQFLYETALADDAMRTHALDLNDQTGKKTRLSLWFTPGNDPFGYLARSEKVVRNVALLMDGDAAVFHSNLLHRSEANLSDRPRWSVISCYNGANNPAYNEQSTSWRVPVEVVPDEAITHWAVESRAAGDFLRKEDDPALK